MQFLALFTILSAIVGPLVRKVLVGLGIGVVSMVGINVLLQGVEALIKAQLTGVGADVAGLMGLAKVDIVVNIMLGAVATRAVIAGMNKSSGSTKKLGSVGQGS